MTPTAKSLFKTARIAGTKHYVSVKFVPATESQEEFFIVTTIDGQVFGLFERELEAFCL